MYTAHSWKWWITSQIAQSDQLLLLKKLDFIESETNSMIDENRQNWWVASVYNIQYMYIIRYARTHSRSCSFFFYLCQPIIGCEYRRLLVANCRQNSCNNLCSLRISRFFFFFFFFANNVLICLTEFGIRSFRDESSDSNFRRLRLFILINGPWHLISHPFERIQWREEVFQRKKKKTNRKKSHVHKNSFVLFPRWIYSDISICLVGWSEFKLPTLPWSTVSFNNYHSSNVCVCAFVCGVRCAFLWLNIVASVNVFWLNEK